MAGSLNKVMLIGRLGQDPKLAYLPSGQPVCEFTLATDESYKDRDGNKVEKTEWSRIKVFGKTAEFCSNYLSKGRLVYVEGSLHTRSWDDQQGQKRYMTEVTVSAPGHRVSFLDSKQDGQGAHRPNPQPQPGSSANAGHSAPGRGQNAAYGGQVGPAQEGYENDDLGPAFPSEASGMDDVPF